MNKTKEIIFAEAIEKLNPPTFESLMVVKSVNGSMYLEEYETVQTEFGKRKKTKAQKGVGNIAIKGFKFIGSQN